MKTEKFEFLADYKKSVDLARFDPTKNNMPVYIR